MCVVLNPEKPCSEAYIRQVLSDRLASYKLPRNILSLANFPTTSTGKIQMQALKAMAKKSISQKQIP